MHIVCKPLAPAVAAALFAIGLAAAQGMPALRDETPVSVSVDVQLVTNAEDGFTVGVPLGWEFASSPQPDYVMADPDGKGFCAVNSVPEPTIDQSNEALREMLSQPLGEKFWDDNVFGDLLNKTYVSTGADPGHPGGWPVQTVVVQSDEQDAGRQIAVTRAAIATIKSKQSFIILCISESKDFEMQKRYFNAVFQSFKVVRP